MKPKRDIEVEINIRRGLINVLDLFSSPEDQVEYQKTVPHVYIPFEMINQWQDWVDHDRKDRYSADIYTQDELDSIWAFDSVWDAESKHIQSNLTMEDTIMTESWRKMIESARRSLQIFKKAAEQGGQPDAASRRPLP